MERRCSFCGQEANGKKLVSGPGVYICAECIELCHDTLTRDASHVERNPALSGLLPPSRWEGAESSNRPIDFVVIGQSVQCTRSSIVVLCIELYSDRFQALLRLSSDNEDVYIGTGARFPDLRIGADSESGRQYLGEKVQGIGIPLTWWLLFEFKPALVHRKEVLNLTVHGIRWHIPGKPEADVIEAGPWTLEIPLDRYPSA